MIAIWTFKTLSDQLDPFWLSREIHLEQLIDPKQLHLRLYRLIHVYMHEMVLNGAILVPAGTHIVWFQIGHEGSQAQSYSAWLPWIPGDPETCIHVSGHPGIQNGSPGDPH